MFRMMVAAAVALAAPTGSVDGVLSSLPHKTDPVHARQLEDAVRASPALSAQLSDLARKGRLRGFAILPPGSARKQGASTLRAWRGNGTITVTADFLDMLGVMDRRFRTLNYESNNPNDLVFVLGFLASKIASEAEMNRLDEQMKMDFQKQAGATPADGQVDVTVFVKRYTDAHIRDDARAHIQGWNDMVDAAEALNSRSLTLKEYADFILKSRYTAVLTKAMKQGINTIVISASLRIAVDEHNIAAVATALRTTPLFEFR